MSASGGAVDLFDCDMTVGTGPTRYRVVVLTSWDRGMNDREL